LVLPLALGSCVGATTHGSVIATSTPLSTQTLADQATLGGTQDAFDAQYGPETFYFCYTSLLASGHQAFFCLTTGLYVSAEAPTTRVTRIFLWPWPLDNAQHTAPWDQQTAQRVVSTLLPPDSVPVRDLQQPHGVEHVYRSARLAATLYATAFRDTNGALLPAGTLAAECGTILPQPGQPAEYGCILRVREFTETAF
jgi:hypothetical protein